MWTEEAKQAFIKHVPRDNFKKVDKEEESEVMRELKALFKKQEAENDYVPAMLDGGYIINRKMMEQYYTKYNGELEKMNEVKKGVDEQGREYVEKVITILTENPQKEEEVLVFPKKIFENSPHWFRGFRRESIASQPKNPPRIFCDGMSPGITETSESEDIPFLQTQTFLSSLHYMPRSKAETDENFLQLIPYCVFKCGKNFLIYQRTKKAGDKRLHGNWSLGCGGHLNPVDGEGFASYEAGMKRELKEEVDFDLTSGNVKNEILGLIYDDSNAVGRVHFGVVHLIEVDNDAVLNFKDEALDKGNWVGYDWLLENAERFENWSQLTIEHLG